MKKVVKIFFVTVVILTNYSFAYSQAITWSKWFDYNNYDNAGEDVIQTFDGGYIVLGNTYESNNYFSILIKTDYLGNIQWQKIIDYSVTHNDPLSCFAIHQTRDSGFTISGYGRDSAVLLKTNIDGNLVWIKKYTIPGLEARFFDHKNTFDGGIIACGDLYPPFNSYIVKTDSSGNTEWSRFYSGYSTRIIQSQDSNFYFSSSNKLSKLNYLGNLIWSYDIPKIGSDLIELSRNSILLAGSNPRMYLTKIDTSGFVLWQKSYFSGAACNSMCISKNNNVLLSGYKDTLLTYYTAVSEVDTLGNELITKIINSASNNYFFIPWAVNSTKDTGFIFTGRADFPGYSFHRDNIFVIKTDSSCNAPQLVGINDNNFFIPEEFKLYQNYPNPFNPVTTIEYDLLKPNEVKLSIYDIKGIEIYNLVNSYQRIGNYKIKFDASNYGLSSGLYFIRLRVDNIPLKLKGITEIKKMIYIK